VGIDECLVHTGQHYDQNMSAVFFEEMGLPEADHFLGIGGGTHGENTGRAIEAIERILLQEEPGLVMVYGDTDSTLAGALAAAKLCMPIAHVEAGLRSFNRAMPEEVNRVLTDHVSTLLFTPSDIATENLKNEGISGGQVVNVGDVMFDAVLLFGEMAARKSSILARVFAQRGQYILVTLHRKENVDDQRRLSQIFEGLARAPVEVILPLHPRTRKRISEFGITVADTIRIIDPVGYLEMMQLEANALAIATDSGGVQKESYFHRVPCITLRDETEWVELVELGVNRLVGADADAIEAALKSLPPEMPVPALYGNGDAGGRIAEVLASL
jgi:UDP-GlcNAc3NAcA epimerase